MPFFVLGYRAPIGLDLLDAMLFVSVFAWVSPLGTTAENAAARPVNIDQGTYQQDFVLRLADATQINRDRLKFVWKNVTPPPAEKAPNNKSVVQIYVIAGCSIADLDESLWIKAASFHL